ncbi:hypothetical protein BOTBODRAFT_55347 [Botryobasidium botryosum FD-172 SS1]|uniref:Uncharacterized protein n=1 Tax=Botryobasidium botryosum (strain FD-172 SS1) TaxID=930990 RepID=A0A067MG58_BOTB1|nr:hypothetical protein BOTBODRAFT_55347 [Botryobasidium botryosum FD-172 SS1]
MEDDRAAKAARAKALLNKRRQQKAGGGGGGTGSGTNSPVIPPARLSSPGPSAAATAAPSGSSKHPFSPPPGRQDAGTPPIERSPLRGRAAESQRATRAVSPEVALSPRASTPRASTPRASTPSLVSPPIHAPVPKALSGRNRPFSPPSPAPASAPTPPPAPAPAPEPVEDLRPILNSQQQTISLLVAEKASLTASLEQLEGFEQKSREADALLEERQHLIDDLGHKITALEAELKAASEAAAEAATRERQMADKQRELERDFDLTKRSAADLRSQFEQCTARIREVEEQLQSDDRVENLEKSLCGTQDRAESLEFQLSKSKQAYAKLKAERDAMEEESRNRAASEEEWKAKHADLSDQHATSLQELQSVSANRDSLQTSVSNLESQVRQGQDSLAQAQQELSAATEELAARTRQLQSVHAELGVVSRRAEDAEKSQNELQSENGGLMASLGELRSKVVELTQDKVDLGETVDELRKTIRERDLKVEELRSLVAELRMQEEEREMARVSESAKYQGEREDLVRQTEGLNQTIAELEAELQSSHAGVRELEIERGSLRQAVSRSEGEAQRAKQASEGIAAEMTILEEQLQEQRRLYEEARAAADEGQAELKRLQTEVDAKDDQIAELQDQVDEYMAIAKAAAEKPEPDLTEEMLSSIRQQHALELSSARSQIRTLESSVHEEQNKAHNLQLQVSALEDQIAELRAAQRGIASKSPLPRPVALARTQSSDWSIPTGRRSSFGDTRPPLSAKRTNSALHPAMMTPEAQHKRQVSLSMLKARIESERSAAAASLNGSTSSLRTMAEEGPRAPTPGLHDIYQVAQHAFKRPQFGDESHVFWCHACRGDLVVL